MCNKWAKLNLCFSSKNISKLYLLHFLCFANICAVFLVKYLTKFNSSLFGSLILQNSFQRAG